MVDQPNKSQTADDTPVATKAEYEVTIAREIAGSHRSKGDRVTMWPEQAKYYLAPNGAGLKVIASSQSGTGKSGTKSGSSGE